MTRGAASWQEGVLDQVESLGRWFGGRLALRPDPADELIPARSLLDLDVLRAAITRKPTLSNAPAPAAGDPVGTQPEGDGLDVGVAASRFTRHYSASLTAVALVGLSAGIGVDLSVERCTLVVRHGLPWTVVLDMPDAEVSSCVERPSPWSTSGPTVDTVDELRAYVWQGLYAANLWPMFERATQIGQISSGVVWSNAAEWLGILSDAAVEYLGDEAAAPLLAETTALLEAPSLPGLPVATNPLAGRLEWLPGDGKGFPDRVLTRKVCCLTYLLPDRFGRLCQGCPYLPPSDRIALIRERHGVPMGDPGGAAEQRAVERGLDRPSTRRMAARREQS